MKKKITELTTSNPMAKLISTGMCFRPQVIKSKKVYNRKKIDNNKLLMGR